MRRKDREVTDSAFFKDVFDKSHVLTVAFIDDGLPYCVPLSFVEVEGSLYFHCAREGRKLDCIANDPHVHFNAFDEIEVDPEKATVYFRSVSGAGMASIVEDEALRAEILVAIMKKYCGKDQIPPSKRPENTLVVKIAVASLTGKQHAKPAA